MTDEHSYVDVEVADLIPRHVENPRLISAFWLAFCMFILFVVAMSLYMFFGVLLQPAAS